MSPFGGNAFFIMQEILKLNEDETSSTVTPAKPKKTMPVNEMEAIRKYLQKLNKKKMNVREKMEGMNHIRKVWNEIKNDYDPKEQENLRKVFNTAYPDLKL